MRFKPARVSVRIRSGVYAPVAERHMHTAKDRDSVGSNPTRCTGSGEKYHKRISWGSMPAWWNGIRITLRLQVFRVRIPERVRAHGAIGRRGGFKSRSERMRVQVSLRPSRIRGGEEHGLAACVLRNTRWPQMPVERKLHASSNLVGCSKRLRKKEWERWKSIIITWPNTYNGR